MTMLSTTVEIPKYLADFFHTYSMVILIKKMRKTSSCSGLSLKTQLLYMIVYLTRYADIFTTKLNTIHRVYLFTMKIIFICLQMLIIFKIKFKYNYTYDRVKDKFYLRYAIIPSLILSLFLKKSVKGIMYYITEYTYTFSILLESVAILPQLVLLQDTGEAEVLTSQYIFILGIYRALYCVHWFFKWVFVRNVSLILILCGVIQTVLYFDFFVVYYNYVFTYKDRSLQG